MNHWFKKLYLKIWNKNKMISLLILTSGFIGMIISLSRTNVNVLEEMARMLGQNPVEDVVNNIGPRSREKLNSYYVKAGVNYPGDKVACLIFEEEKSMELWAKNKDRWHLIHTQPTKRGSISNGEGLYKIIGLNSNVWYPLSMRFQSENSSDYCFDVFLDRASFPMDCVHVGHDELSAGCLSLSDNQFEELFILAHDININNMEIIMSHIDLRKKDPKINDAWYRWIKESLQRFK